MDSTTPRQIRLAALRVIKKIAPHQRGAKSLTAEYGDRLVCVRHRIDPTGTQRLTTVELIVSQKKIVPRPSPMVDVVLQVHERALQNRLKAAGARWSPERQVWRIRRATAIALGLKHRLLLPQT